MSQSSKIAMYLFLGFVVYTAIKGHLAYYLGYLGLGTASSSTPSAAATQAGSGYYSAM